MIQENTTKDISNIFMNAILKTFKESCITLSEEERNTIIKYNGSQCTLERALISNRRIHTLEKHSNDNKIKDAEEPYNNGYIEVVKSEFILNMDNAWIGFQTEWYVRNPFPHLSDSKDWIRDFDNEMKRTMNILRARCRPEDLMYTAEEYVQSTIALSEPVYNMFKKNTDYETVKLALMPK